MTWLFSEPDGRFFEVAAASKYNGPHDFAAWGGGQDAKLPEDKPTLRRDRLTTRFDLENIVQAIIGCLAHDLLDTHGPGRRPRPAQHDGGQTQPDKTRADADAKHNNIHSETGDHLFHLTCLRLI